MLPPKVILDMAREVRRQAEAIIAAKARMIGGDNPDRDKIERELTRTLGGDFEEQRRELFSLLGNPPRMQDVPSEFWARWGERFTSRVQPVLQNMYIQRALELGDKLTIGLDWQLVNQNAATWARQYTYDLVTGVTNTTRELLRNSIESFYANQMTREALEELLQRGFDPARASMIAVTEVTRASSQGEIAVQNDLAQYGIEMLPFWATNNDELVCPICGPLNGKKAAGKSGDEPYWIHPQTNVQYSPPPAHPNCRCWVNLRLR